MKKVLTIGFMFLIIFLISSSGYSQDTTDAVQSDPVGQPLVTKEKSASKWEYSVNFTGKKVMGYTEFHIKFPDYGLEGHSLLAFPIDGISSCVNFSCKKVISNSKGREYGFDISMEKVLTNPKEAMADSDWVTFPGDEDPANRWVNGATKSDAELIGFGINCRAKYSFPMNKFVSCVLGIGYRYQNYYYDVRGLSGWYEDPYYHYILLPEYFEGLNVLDYKVNYHLPYVGLDINLKNQEGIDLIIGGNYYYALANDFDDHLLRYKNSESHCNGSGYTLSGATRIKVITFKSGQTLFLCGGYSITRIKTTGTQVQKYYGDDPDTPNEEIITTSNSIDNTISLKQNTITAQLEYQF